MITKEQFCKMIIKEYLKDENQEKINDWDILKSSNLAVCMEFLGIIKDNEAKEYASSRGGVIFTYCDIENENIATLSARELIEILPN